MQGRTLQKYTVMEDIAGVDFAGLCSDGVDFSELS